MNQEDFLSCDVCKELFNGSNRIPRMLSCGHSFCSLCLSTIVLEAKNARCPLCQISVSYSSLYEIPVNYNLKQVAENFEQTSEPHSSTQSSLTFNSASGNTVQETTYGICIRHNTQQKYFCKDCNVFLCDECSRSDHKKCSKPALISTVLELKTSQCDTKIENLMTKSSMEERRLKRLSDQVLNDLQIYLNLAEEQEKDLRMTRDLVHCLNADLSKISSIEEQLKAKSHFYSMIKLRNSKVDNKSFSVIVNRETQLRTELEALKTLSSDVQQCETAVKEDLKSCDNTIKESTAVYSKSTAQKKQGQTLGQILELSMRKTVKRKDPSKKFPSKEVCGASSVIPQYEVPTSSVSFKSSNFSSAGNIMQEAAVSSVTYPYSHKPLTRLSGPAAVPQQQQSRKTENIDKFIAQLDEFLIENSKSMD